MRDLNLRTREGRQTFYKSPKWRRLRNQKKQDQPLCESCLKKGILKPMDAVHHIIDISDKLTEENALDYSNLMSLCDSCHSKITSQKKRGVWKPFNLKEFMDKNSLE